MYANVVTKAQLDHILINKKWKDSAIDCATYNIFHSVSSHHKKLPSNADFVSEQINQENTHQNLIGVN